MMSGRVCHAFAATFGGAKSTGSAGRESMLPNARNESMSSRTDSAKKAVPCQNGFCTPTLLQGTAYGSLVEDTPPAPHRPLAAGFLEEFSHPGPVETSPSGPRHAARLAPLGHATADPHPARPHLVLRRFPGGTLRDRPRLRRRLPAQAAPAGKDRARLRQGPGAPAPAGPARRGC